MAGVAQELDLEGLANWAGMQAAQLSSPDFRKPLTAAKYLIGNAVKENFQGAHDPEGQSWPPLKKPRKGGGTHPLWDTGRLVASTGSGQGHVEEITRDSLTVGTNLEYAAIHNYGGTVNIPEHQGDAVTKLDKKSGRRLFAKKKKFGQMETRHYQFIVPAHQVTIPQRQFMGIGQRLGDEIGELFGKFAEEQLGG